MDIRVVKRLSALSFIVILVGLLFLCRGMFFTADKIDSRFIIYVSCGLGIILVGGIGMIFACKMDIYIRGIARAKKKLSMEQVSMVKLNQLAVLAEDSPDEARDAVVGIDVLFPNDLKIRLNGPVLDEKMIEQVRDAALRDYQKALEECETAKDDLADVKTSEPCYMKFWKTVLFANSMKA